MLKIFKINKELKRDPRFCFKNKYLKILKNNSKMNFKKINKKK